MPQLKIAVVISTTRPGRLGASLTNWLAAIAKQRSDAAFEIVDLRDYPLPFFEEEIPPAFKPSGHAVAQRWSAKMAEFDAYIFVTAEYNHSLSGVLKNALDYLSSELKRKPAAFLGYGAVGGARAVEHLRHILAELHVATIKPSVHIGRAEMLGLLREGKTMADFPYLADLVPPMLDDLLWWAGALRTARSAS